MKTILKVDLSGIGPENILFVGMCADISAQKLYGLGRWKGLKSAHHLTGGRGIFNVLEGLSA